MLFFDVPAEGFKQYAWQLQHDIVVTRGQILTPEQNLPDKAVPGPLEACLQWEPIGMSYQRLTPKWYGNYKYAHRNRGQRWQPVDECWSKTRW